MQYGLVLAYAATFLYKAKFVVLVYYGDFCVIVINGWMTKKVFMETVQYQTLLDCAQVGWWETDFEAGCYICSDFLIGLLELKGPQLSITDFYSLIREDYRSRIANEFAFFREIGIYEQAFPIKTCYGYRFVRTKIYKHGVESNGKIKAFGILLMEVTKRV